MSTKSLTAAIKQTRRYQWDELLKEETRWSRKLTIATNKLAAVQKRMASFTQECIETIEEKRLI